MRRFLEKFPFSTGLTVPATPAPITLVGLLPAYTSPPLLGQDVDTNLIPADTGDFASTAGTIATVDTLIRVEVSPDTFNEYPYQNGALDPVQPGDRLTPISVVTDSVANTDRFSGLTVTIALPAPTITSQPVLPAVLVAGMTTFNVDFGAAGPVGTSGFLGVYTPTLSRIFTINGADRTSELTLVSGYNYTWNGAALPVNATVSARASWTNATGTTLSSTVTRTAGALFQLSRDDLTYEAVMTNAEGIVTGNVTSPAPYSTYTGPAGAGTFAIDSTLLSSGPVVMFPPVIADVAGTFTLTQEAVWTRANAATGFTQGGQWYRDGVAVSGQTSPIYSGPAYTTSLEWRATASDSTGTRVQASNQFTSVVSTQTLLDGQANTLNSGTHTYTPVLTGSSSGDILIIGVAVQIGSSTTNIASVSLGANLATLVATSSETVSTAEVKFYRVTHPGGSPNITITSSGVNFQRSHMVVWKVTGASATALEVGTFSAANTSGPGSMNLNVTSGKILLAMVLGTGNNGSTHATTGLGTAVYSNTIPTNLLKTEAFALIAGSTESPRAVSTTWTGNAVVVGLAITI